MDYTLLGVIFVLIMLIVYSNSKWFHSSSKMFAVKDLLVFKNVKETMTAVVNENGYNIDTNWNDFCIGADAGCTEYNIMDKSQFQDIVDKMMVYIDSNKETLNAINGVWTFKSRSKYINVSHQHTRVGDLIYHLKDLDNDIFYKIYNDLGQIPSLFEKVAYIFNRQDYIKDRDETKIQLVYEILDKLNTMYQKHGSDIESSAALFPRKDVCKTIKRTSYNPSNMGGLSNDIVGCPDKHY